MKKLTAYLIVLALFSYACPAGAESFEIGVGDATFEVTFEGVEVADGQVVAKVGGYAGGLPIINGQVTVPFWAYATKDGERFYTSSVNLQFDGGTGDFAFTIKIDALPDAIYIFPDGAEDAAVLVWSAADAPEAVVWSADDILWSDYRLRVTGATTDADALGMPEPAQGYLLMVSYEERNGGEIPADVIATSYGELALRLDGADISPDDVRPTVEAMNGAPQAAFSLVYYIPDGEAALSDMVLSCGGLSYALPSADVATEAAQDSPFSDAGFEEAVRASAGIPEGPITDEVLASVTELIIDTDDCLDISGLALLPNLEALSVCGFLIEDFSPLTCATNLKDLRVTDAALTDLSLISGCENLETLFIGNCMVTDLTPLSGLSALESLTLMNLRVSDLASLADHAALKYLDLTDCDVSNLAPLSGCAGLETLILAQNPVTDISPVAALPNLMSLDLSGCMVSDLTPLVDAVDEGLDVELSGNVTTEMPSRTAEDAMELVLRALDEALYVAARDYLSTGETIGSGSRGDPARGLQTLVAALGQDIKIDGNVGPKTMKALNEVEAVFRMDEAVQVDMQTFDRLLMMLLIATDEDDAWEILSDGLMEDDEFDYYAASAQEAQGNYYSAMLLFGDIDYLDSAERAEACVLTWPKNGELYRNPAYGGKKTHLNIKVDGDVEYATFIKIYAENGDYVLAAFIGGSSSTTVKIPGGTYFIKKGTGYDWYGVNEAFGDDGYYATLYFDDGAQEVTLKSGYEYTLTLNTAYDDPDASDVGTEGIDWDAF